MKSWKIRLGLVLTMLTMLLALAAPVAQAEVLGDDDIGLSAANVDVDTEEVSDESDLEGECVVEDLDDSGSIDQWEIDITCYVEDEDDDDDEEDDEDDEDDDEEDDDDDD